MPPVVKINIEREQGTQVARLQNLGMVQNLRFG